MMASVRASSCLHSICFRPLAVLLATRSYERRRGRFGPLQAGLTVRTLDGVFHVDLDHDGESSLDYITSLGKRGYSIASCMARDMASLRKGNEAELRRRR